MIHWLSENIATIVVLAVLVGIISLIVAGMLRGRKKGKSPCACGCGGCDLCSNCPGSKQ